MNTNYELLKAIRERYGTQRKFAKVIKMSCAVVSLVINGRYNLHDTEKNCWAKALDCAVDELFPTIYNR